MSASLNTPVSMTDSSFVYAEPVKTLSEFTVLPTVPTNVIFTGVAGTGKTHQLQQLQRLYDETLPDTAAQVAAAELQNYNWRDVICAVLLSEDRTMSVPEMIRHPLIQAKIAANGRTDNVSQTLWVQLNTHTHPDSTTVNYAQRSANYYFDKNTDSTWYLLEEVKASLRDNLAPLLEIQVAITQKPGANTTQKIIRTSFVSFHQAYGYEEFVEGMRPAIGGQGQLSYQIQPGAFLKLCQRAAQDPEHRYAMLIDEINRANVARVFGELMSLIEPSKRAGQADAMQVTLAYSNKVFSVPSNVDIYATMNTQDHSLLALDTAFRRRFRFSDCPPRAELLPVIAGTNDATGTLDLGRLLTGLNARLCQTLGQDSQLGHAYFMGITNLAELQQTLIQQIVPQLAQATGGQVELLRYLFNDLSAAHEAQFIHTSPSHNGAPINLMQNSAPLSAGMNTGFWLNPDFMSYRGVFCTAQPYQRLYA
ncbi:McrB family protein [Psychrobacter arenosus]|uniref:McrB family protein n=1 Tax=Psychrobacter arenosus TaxID=256326 RepID=UPI001D11798A|nr:AAA family ATPase [Psychrobacter arenosus]